MVLTLLPKTNNITGIATDVVCHNRQSFCKTCELRCFQSFPVLCFVIIAVVVSTITGTVAITVTNTVTTIFLLLLLPLCSFVVLSWLL